MIVVKVHTMSSVIEGRINKMNRFINKIQLTTLIAFFICFIITSINLIYQLLNDMFDEVSLLLWVLCLVAYLINSFVVMLNSKGDR